MKRKLIYHTSIGPVTRITILLSLFLVLINNEVYPSTFRIKSLKGYSEIESKLKPGDSIIWENGTYKDIIWIIRHNGLNILPETPGKVIFTGSSVTEITADNVNFSDFQYLDGITTGDVVKISGSHNKISGINISGYHSHYYLHITTQGRYNSIENCNFENKPPAAPGKEGNSIFQVAVDSVSPGYNVIRYCSFRNHQAPPNSGGDYGMEALRIGYSFQAKFISRTITEYCFFTRCNGDGEIISNKARENIFRYNTFTENGESHLTLRHGSDNVVYGNFFINGAGIRIKEGQNQMVYNNYFNTRSFFAIRLENYRVDPLKNIVIAYNTFAGSGPLRLGGKGDFQPAEVKVIRNLFINPSGLIVDDPTGNEHFIGNGYMSEVSPVQTGFFKVSEELEQNNDGYYQTLTRILPGKQGKSDLQVLDIPELNDDPAILLDISANRRSGKNRSAGCFEPVKNSKPVKPYVTASNTGPSYLSKGDATGYRSSVSGSVSLVIEIESASELNGWSAGETTDSGRVIKYLYWDGEDFFNEPGRHMLEYKIEVTVPGTYRFIWNTKVGKGESPTDFNDTWLRITDASDFYGDRNGHIVHPKGICRDDCPNGAGADGWFKVYSSGTVNWTWSTRTSDNDAHNIYARFDKPGIYTVQVSARSNGHFLNSFLLYKE